MTSNRKVGYEHFLASVAADIRSKRDQEDNYTQVSDTEFKQIVSIVFRDSIIRFTKDSHLYRTELPIDLHYNVDRYDLIPPKDFIIESVIGTKDHKIKAPKMCTELDSVRLLCKPVKTIHTAFFVEVALSPMRTITNCELDFQFVERYYDVILHAMLERLYNQRSREWYSRVQSNQSKRDYKNALNDARRGRVTAGGNISLTTGRMSDGAAR